MPDFLLEIGCEEIPARMIYQANQELQRRVAALLKISELGYFQAVEHDLPANAPRPQRGRLPVVLFKLEIMLAQVNAQCSERLQI